MKRTQKNYSDSTKELASKLFYLFRRLDPNAFIQGDPDKTDTTETIIDGSFSLFELAAEVEKALSETLRPDMREYGIDPE